MIQSLESATRDEVSVTPYRRSYQTALRCKSCKAAVVNGQRKGSQNESGKSSRDECKWIADEVTKSHKLSGKIALCKGCRDKHSGNLLTGYVPTVIQATWLEDGLYYGTRDTHLGKLKEIPMAKMGVGLSHSSEENPWKRKGAKGLGYSVIFKINNHVKAWQDFLWNYK